MRAAAASASAGGAAGVGSSNVYSAGVERTGGAESSDMAADGFGSGEVGRWGSARGKGKTFFFFFCPWWRVKNELSVDGGVALMAGYKFAVRPRTPSSPKVWRRSGRGLHSGLETAATGLVCCFTLPVSFTRLRQR